MAVPQLPIISVEEEESSGFSFPAPQGFALPDTANEGDLFDAVVKVRLQDGQILVDSINGSKLSGEPEEEETEEVEETESDEEPDTLEAAIIAEGY